jgi:hypothetical protein
VALGPRILVYYPTTLIGSRILAYAARVLITVLPQYLLSYEVNDTNKLVEVIKDLKLNFKNGRAYVCEPG